MHRSSPSLLNGQRSYWMKPHPIVAAAARGELPSWAEVSKGRRRHIERVGALLDEWADEAGLSESDRTRWKAAGWLHDSLKDGSGRALREIVEPSLRQLPTPMLHGPAAAELLRREGVEDQGLLLAVAYHTLGHPDLGRVGFALYAADYLEPGRRIRKRWRAKLRERMPADLERVVQKILHSRITFLLKKGRPLHPATVGFWNRMAKGEPWAHASEV